MDNILNKSGLLKLEILQNQWVILGDIVGIVVIVIAAKIVNINLANSKEPSDEEPQENYERIKPSDCRVIGHIQV